MKGVWNCLPHKSSQIVARNQAVQHIFNVSVNRKIRVAFEHLKNATFALSTSKQSLITGINMTSNSFWRVKTS